MCMRNGFSFAPISKLAEIQGFQQREKMTAAQSRSLARTAEDIGLAIIQMHELQDELTPGLMR